MEHPVSDMLQLVAVHVVGVVVVVGSRSIGIHVHLIVCGRNVIIQTNDGM